MKNILFFSVFLSIVSCKQNQVVNSSQEILIDNSELIDIYTSDQKERKVDSIDWQVTVVNDSLRRVRVYQLLDSGLVRTSNDYHNAAMVFQHGMDSVAYGMAVKLMKKSIELDSTVDKWLLAAAIDRDLLSRDKPQIYGTQYTRKNSEESWRLQDIDTTVISDQERIEHRVETLAQQKEKVKRMNAKKLSSILDGGKSIDELITIAINQNGDSSEYDVSESSINSLGYALMSEDKIQDALKLLKLNTELYPEGFNTFDSYGECLLKIGDKELAKIAYKKSLELNPNNTNATDVLNSL